MIPFLGKLPWRLIAKIALPAALVLLVWWAIASWGNRREAEGRADEIAKYEAAERKATAEHNARIEGINRDHDQKLTTLQAERDAALARPSTRTIRVPVSAVCPPVSPSDAGVLEPDPGHRLLEINDPGYGRFQDWLTEFAGATEGGG